MRFRIPIGIALILCAARLCFPPWHGTAREVTTTHYSGSGFRSDSSIRFFDWRISARWRLADNDLSQDRFYAGLEKLFAESQSAAVSESLTIAKKDPFAFIYDSVSQNKVDAIRHQFSDRIEKELTRSALAETTALKAARVPLERTLPKFQSQIYGWQSRNYTFDFAVDSRRLLFEAAIVIILGTAAFLLAPATRALGKRPTTPGNAT